MQLWTEAKFGNKELDALNDLRGRARFYTSTISYLLDTVTSGSLGRIERSLDEAGLKDLKPAIEDIARNLVASNREEGSVLTAYTNDDSAVWKDLRPELVKAKLVPSDIISQHRDLIHDFIRELGERGTLDVAPTEAMPNTSIRGKPPRLPRGMPSELKESLAILAPGRKSSRAEFKDESRFHRRDLAEEPGNSCSESSSHGYRSADILQVRIEEQPSRSSRRRRTRSRRKRQSTKYSLDIESFLKEISLFPPTALHDRSDWKTLNRQSKMLDKMRDCELGRQHGLDEAIISGVSNPTSHEALLNLGFGDRIPELLANIPFAERVPGHTSSFEPRFQCSRCVLLHTKARITFIATPWGICLIADGFNASFMVEYIKYVTDLVRAVRNSWSDRGSYEDNSQNVFKIIDFMYRLTFEWDQLKGGILSGRKTDHSYDLEEWTESEANFEGLAYGLDSRGDSWSSNFVSAKGVRPLQQHRTIMASARLAERPTIFGECCSKPVPLIVNQT